MGARGYNKLLMIELRLGQLPSLEHQHYQILSGGPIQMRLKPLCQPTLSQPLLRLLIEGICGTMVHAQQ